MESETKKSPSVMESFYKVEDFLYGQGRKKTD